VNSPSDHGSTNPAGNPLADSCGTVPWTVSTASEGQPPLLTKALTEIADLREERDHWKRQREDALEAWGDAEQELDALRMAVREAIDACEDGGWSMQLLYGLRRLLPPSVPRGEPWP
jgi:hypothetical protein